MRLRYSRAPFMAHFWLHHFLVNFYGIRFDILPRASFFGSFVDGPFAVWQFIRFFAVAVLVLASCLTSGPARCAYSSPQLLSRVLSDTFYCSHFERSLICCMPLIARVLSDAASSALLVLSFYGCGLF